MRNLLLSLLLAVSAFTSAHAFSSLPVQDCDTILTKKGKVLVVRIVSANRDKIRYQYCSDSMGAPIRFIARENVKIVLKAQPVAPPVDTPPTMVENQNADNKDLPPSATDQDRADLAPIEVAPSPISPEDMAAYQKKAREVAKKAAFYSFSSVFLCLFAFAFSPWLLILIIPFTIAGFIFSTRGLKMTKGRPNLKKERRLSGLSLAMSLLYGGIVAAYIMILVVVLAFVLLFGF